MCGYNLHRLRGSKCPECGQTLELRIALAEPRLAAFYTGLVGLAAGVGFAAFVMVYIVVESFFIGFAAVWWLALLPAEAVVLGVLAVVWIRNSGKIRRCSVHVRWALAASAWLLSSLGVLLFGLAANT